MAIFSRGRSAPVGSSDPSGGYFNSPPASHWSFAQAAMITGVENRSKSIATRGQTASVVLPDP